MADSVYVEGDFREFLELDPLTKGTAQQVHQELVRMRNDLAHVNLSIPMKVPPIPPHGALTDQWKHDAKVYADMLKAKLREWLADRQRLFCKLGIRHH